MAFCTNCGKQIPEGAAFCTNCGKPVSAAPAGGGTENGSAGIGALMGSNNGYAASGGSYGTGYTGSRGTGYGSPRTVPYTYAGTRTDGPAAAVREDGVVRQIREVGGSPLHLALIVSMALSAVLSILTGSGLLPGVLGSSEYGSMLISVLTSVPTVLTMAGLLTFYLECRKEEQPKGSGLGLYRAAKITAIVFLGFSALLGLVMAVFGGALFLGSDIPISQMIGEILQEAGISGDVDVSVLLTVFTVVVAIALGIGFVLSLILQIKLIKSARIVETALEKGRRGDLLPMYPLVLRGIQAAASVLSVLNHVGVFFGGYVDAANRVPTALASLTVIAGCVEAVLSVVMLAKIRQAVD